MKYQLADLVNGQYGEVFTDKEVADQAYADAVAEGKRINLENSGGESDMGCWGGKPQSVEDFISLVNIPEITSIKYYADTSTMGGITEAQAVNYRQWAYSELKAAYPDADIEVVDFGSVGDSIIIADADCDTDDALSFCRELFDRCPWPEAWNQVDGEE